jgi:hypothetical protein
MKIILVSVADLDKPHFDLAKVIATAQHALPRSALNWLSDIPARVIRERPAK